MRNVAWRRRMALALGFGGAMLFGFGGCLGFNVGELLRFGADHSTTEFEFDDSAFPELDLFPDGGNGSSGSGL